MGIVGSRRIALGPPGCAHARHSPPRIQKVAALLHYNRPFRAIGRYSTSYKSVLGQQRRIVIGSPPLGQALAILDGAATAGGLYALNSLYGGVAIGTVLGRVYPPTEFRPGSGNFGNRMHALIT